MTTQIARRFRKSDVLRMFPSFVWKAELRPGIREPVIETILRMLGEIGAPLNDLKLGAVRGGVALFIDVGTEAYFANLTVRP